MHTNRHPKAQAKAIAIVRDIRLQVAMALSAVGFVLFCLARI